jgi:hypothetical protein
MPAAKTDSDSGSKPIGRNTGISLGLAAMLLSPLIMAVIFVVMANSRTQSLEARVETLEAKVDAHMREGLDGIPHPAGIRVALDKVQDEMARRTTDRWSRADDRNFMREFTHLNQLKCPDHKRIGE